jgi:DNA invertase Pin-like site-specific DNA recombinase
MSVLDGGKSGRGQFPPPDCRHQEVRCSPEHQGRRRIRGNAVPGATELNDRPALVAMLEALAADGVRLVLIEKLDRLARDLMVQETIIGDLQKRGFRLISVGEPDLLKNDPSRKLMRQIFGVGRRPFRALS